MTSFAGLTTIAVGGPIAHLVVAEQDAEVVDAVREDAFVLGGGSNLVVGDAPFERRVVRIATRGIDVQRDGERIIVEAAAGEPWDELVEFTVAQGWSGLESLGGIPGLVGATPVQNVGAYGQEVGAVIGHVTALDRATGAIESLDASACRFGYRTSLLKQHPGRWVVLSVSFVLRSDADSTVRYAELAALLGIEPNQDAPVPRVHEAVLALRRAKGMLLDPADPDTRSTGSFFVNPVVDPGTAAALGQCPRYPAPDGVKVSAAWLIEQSGIDRGWSPPELGGRVRISTKHTLAIANAGGGTADDVIVLAGQVRDRVRDRFGITLVPEPELVDCSL
ncbi:MAG: UDP-N-acetylmuramate dehydrogenase [Actinomycetales bacterium]|nr:UDP-N-acetylmuramate dehydrogenase [Actinomycetales bacterium]